MTVSRSAEFEIALAEVLGLDPEVTGSITLEVPAGGVPVVVVRQYVRLETLPKLHEVLRRFEYRIIEVEP